MGGQAIVSRARAGRILRSELEKIVGSAALDERPVRDMWPLAIMDERAGKPPPRVLVVRPADREQVAAILRWAGANRVIVTPMGGATGVCGALSPEAGEVVLDMGAFDRILEVHEKNLMCRCESGVNGLVLEKHLNERGLTLGHFPSSLPGTTVGGASPSWLAGSSKEIAKCVWPKRQSGLVEALRARSASSSSKIYASSSHGDPWQISIRSSMMCGPRGN